MANEKTWTAWKEKGNALYSTNHFKEASAMYSKAIETLLAMANNNELPQKSKTELAKLFSNRSVTYYRLSSIEFDEQTALLTNALEDAKRCIKEDPKFQKGYYRCFDALLAMKKDEEAASYLTRLMSVVNKTDIAKVRSDKGLYSAMQRVRYYSLTKKESPNWSKVKYPDHCVVVDCEGAGDFTSITQAVAMQSQVSILVRPGLYKTSQLPTVIKPSQSVDIIGDVVGKHEEVIFSCTGSAFAPETNHILAVFGGKLRVTGVTLRQDAQHPEVHAVCGQAGAEIELNNIHGFSKMSACVAATGSKITITHSEFETCGAIILVGETEGSIKHCRIRKCIRMGIELRDRAHAVIEDTEIVGCGMQAVVSHAGAHGFDLIRCQLHNNARQLVNEGSVMMSAGSGKIIDTQITGNVAGGVMVDSGGHAELSGCLITGGRFGLGFSMGGSAHIKDCKIRSAMVGMAIMHNLHKDIVFENSKIEKCPLVVNKSDHDAYPKMIGQKYTVQNVGLNEKLPGEVDVMKNMQKVKMQSKLKKPETGMYDPRASSVHTERICVPCGLSQTTKGYSFKVCAKCKMAWYCSKECQKKGWPLHKEECVNMQEWLKK